jgi:hypothetical protein
MTEYSAKRDASDPDCDYPDNITRTTSDELSEGTR